MLSGHFPHPIPNCRVKPQPLQPQYSPEHCRHRDLARIDAGTLMGSVAIVDVTVQRTCDVYLERIGECYRVARGAYNISEDAVVLGNVKGAVMILDCHVDCGLTEETSGVAEAGAFHETWFVSWEVQ